MIITAYHKPALHWGVFDRDLSVSAFLSRLRTASVSPQRFYCITSSVLPRRFTVCHPVYSYPKGGRASEFANRSPTRGVSKERIERRLAKRNENWAAMVVCQRFLMLMATKRRSVIQSMTSNAKNMKVVLVAKDDTSLVCEEPLDWGKVFEVW